MTFLYLPILALVRKEFLANYERFAYFTLCEAIGMQDVKWSLIADRALYKNGSATSTLFSFRRKPNTRDWILSERNFTPDSIELKLYWLEQFSR